MNISNINNNHNTNIKNSNNNYKLLNDKMNRLNNDFIDLEMKVNTNLNVKNDIKKDLNNFNKEMIKDK